MGPVTGEAPHLRTSPDSLYNIWDIMAFTRMWNWSVQEELAPSLAKSTSFNSAPVTLNGEIFQLDIPQESQSGQWIFKFEPESAAPKLVSRPEGSDWMILSKTDSLNGRFIIEYGFLGKEKTSARLTINAGIMGRNNTAVTNSLAFFNKDGSLIWQEKSEHELVPVPERYALHHNFPNPFNPVTTIQYDLPEAVPVMLTIYDIRGREIIRLVQSEQPAGYFEVQWNGVNQFGQSVASGIYFYMLQTPKYSKSHKMLFIK